MNGESPDDFVHLHVRSGFSFGFGVARPEELVEAAARMGMPSLALTDRDGLYGIPRFLEAACRAGILPIVGAQVSTAGGHVVLLAESMEGYRSLCRLITDYRTSSEDRRRPVCPLGKILEHKEGLICLTGAVPFGLLPRLILAGQRKEATEVLRCLQEAFGDRLYVELTDDETATGRRSMGKVAGLCAGHWRTGRCRWRCGLPLPLGPQAARRTRCCREPHGASRPGVQADRPVASQVREGDTAALRGLSRGPGERC